MKKENTSSKPQDEVLLACPFCEGKFIPEHPNMYGRSPYTSQPKLEELTAGGWRVICYGCGVHTSNNLNYNREQAIAAWNTRGGATQTIMETPAGSALVPCSAALALADGRERIAQMFRDTGEEDGEQDEMAIVHTIRDLVIALNDANELCRSAMEITRRRGQATNWDAFRDRLEASLERQHRIRFPEPNGDVLSAGIGLQCLDGATAGDKAGQYG